MLAPAGVPVNFAAVFEDAVANRVGMTVYDDTGSSPVLLLSPFLMALVHSETYRGKFTPAAGKLYIVIMAVYTDSSLTTIDLSFTEQSVAVVAQNVNPPIQSLVGVVECGGA